ncbi:putative bifunctional diguanylate cyclase/phosphodiesterase [Saccharospirillum impatiens]|uniref:putative bifunctional diguanylate cyclase/phosphodiesterase n=1 Tax=Saccharospirillum impatiens TaxID=169438 RepID=UPI0004267863|nr:EAL domain-containing protein [Saccharospirillum impatiens]
MRIHSAGAPETAASKPEESASVAEIRRLGKIIDALMDRAERSMAQQGSDFGLFQTALTLESTVQQRTQELARALEYNEHITQNLYRLTRDLKEEISQRKRVEAMRNGQYDVLELIAAHAPLNAILRQLAHWVEAQGHVGLASILLLDDSGLSIGQCIAPSLPEDYNNALLGVDIGPKVGSCGTAMYLNQSVEVTDIATDPLWDDYRDLAMGFGLRACWSSPITTQSNQVVGSFAIYYREVQGPSDEQRALIATAVHLAGIAMDRARAEARIQYMAHHDELTGLPNRALLLDRIDGAIESARRRQSRTAVLMIDLDRFKHVNDSLGHQTGDVLLKEVAGRLNRCVRSSDTIARLGGDEFVICLPDIGFDTTASTVAAKVMHELEALFYVRNQTLKLGASIGISLFPEDGDSANDLLRTADTAMYSAKKSGRGQYCYFTHELNQAAHEHLVLLSQLQHAIRNDEFELFYQPLYRLSDNRLTGAEALLRWNHPQRGVLAPGEFMYLLEEHGLMVEVGHWVLQTACAQSAAWHQQGLSCRVSVNLAADQFYRGNVLKSVKTALEASGLPASGLLLEFTETVLLHHSDSIIAIMHQLKRLGVQLSLDDFGTGYSSLSYLHRFPVDQLKIDRSFISGIDQHSSAMNIVTSIVQLASSLGIQSVAEGLETQAQLHALARLECDFGQGYVLGYPMPASEFGRILAQDAE